VRLLFASQQDARSRGAASGSQAGTCICNGSLARKRLRWNLRIDLDLRTGGIEDRYGLAIPAAEFLEFLDKHLPATAKQSAADTSDVDMSWNKVDERASSGVLMVVKKN
jgi:hypothetical protein